MTLAATDLTGWWIGYIVGSLVVLVVAVVVIAIIMTARSISHAAADITRSLALARDRTEPLWQVGTTDRVARDILEAAREARRTLGAEVPAEGNVAHDPGDDLKGERPAREAMRHSMRPGPDLDPEEGA